MGDNLIFGLSDNPPFAYWQAGGPACPVENYDIPTYHLTIQDGTVYTIQRDDLGKHEIEIEPGKFKTVHNYGRARVTRIDRPNGEYLAISDSGIKHHTPSGEETRALYFERGVGNRIVAVRDVQSQSSSVPPLVKYEYDGQGNLVYVHKLLDRAKNTFTTTTYVYGRAAFGRRAECPGPRRTAAARETVCEAVGPCDGR